MPIARAAALIECSRSTASSSATLPGPMRSSPPNSTRRNNVGRAGPSRGAGGGRRAGAAARPPYRRLPPCQAAAAFATCIASTPCATARFDALTTAFSVAVTMFGSRPTPNTATSCPMRSCT